MAAILIRQLDERTKSRLRRQAAAHRRSMEAEARSILKAGLQPTVKPAGNLYDSIRRIVEPLGGIELEVPAREPMRDSLDFGRAEFNKKR